MELPVVPSADRLVAMDMRGGFGFASRKCCVLELEALTETHRVEGSTAEGRGCKHSTFTVYETRGETFVKQ